MKTNMFLHQSNDVIIANCLILFWRFSKIFKFFFTATKYFEPYNISDKVLILSGSVNGTYASNGTAEIIDISDPNVFCDNYEPAEEWNGYYGATG